MNGKPEKPAPGDMLERLSQIELLSLDVDGVLTDGGIYYTDDGNTFRKFNAQDGMGLVRVRKAGVTVTIISAGAPGAIEHRARRLGIKHVFTDVPDKLAVLGALAGELGIGMHQVAHVGDDVNDLPLMQASGLAVASANAVPEVMEAAAIVTRCRGGEGAVRELCDAMLRARGHGLETNHTFESHLPGEGKGGT